MDTTIRPRRDFKALEDRRFEAGSLFSQGKFQAEIVRRLDVSRPTAHRWYHIWRRKGRNGLRGAGRAGRMPRLDQRTRMHLAAALEKGPEKWGFKTHLWTLDRIAKVIEKTCQVKYHPHHVWRILRSLGWSRQRPARRAVERDEKAIMRWVRVRWPEVKKTQNA